MDGLSDCQARGGRAGLSPSIPCSRSARPQKALARRPQWNRG
ncbi:MAG: hypothetical protein OJF47_001417 [Nitrospira sp.]|nr:MAG: hypothetical protein OJF47_001417 [Nitrospira sp.]